MSPHFFVILSRKVCLSLRILALLYYHLQRSSFPLFFLVFSFPTSMTTRSDCCFHRKFFPEPSYFCHISSGGPAVSHPSKVVVNNTGQRVGMLFRLCCVVGTFQFRMRRPGTMLVRKPAGRQGWQQMTRRPPQTRNLALMPEHWP